MSNIDALKGRLQELSNRLTAKDKLGKEYKQLVSNSLATIKAKITTILADHNKQVRDITRGSAENLEKTRAELAAQQARLKQASDAALEGARRNQNELENNLAATNQQLNDLQAELNKPNPDIPKLQGDIEKLRQDLQTATDASAAANGRIVELTARLVAYDGMRDKMDKLVQSLIDQIGKIITQVEIMSINQDDVVELMQLLEDTKNLFPKDDGAPPGNDDGGGIFGNLFGAPSAAGAGSGVGAGAGSSGLPPPKQPRRHNTAPGQYDGGVLKLIPGNKLGGKTKRRRSKKTMYRGGYYLEKKSATRNRRNRPRTSSRRRSSSSSSSASSNSRQKAMKRRKM